MNISLDILPYYRYLPLSPSLSQLHISLSPSLYSSLSKLHISLPSLNTCPRCTPLSLPVLVSGRITGRVTGLVSGLVTGMVTGLVTGMVTGLFTGLVTGPLIKAVCLTEGPSFACCHLKGKHQNSSKHVLSTKITCKAHPTTSWTSSQNNSHNPVQVSRAARGPFRPAI